ncbi:uncharacterized protein LOC128873574 [Hylaeus volcanicus]|uniref:uncharacterized protein LOC128873574 n=1 Tax=Hylaeus volcanicus TaxID=313075 RepID=UPI0023B7D81B|nr:uncharacterized protein LOC128873574 [Hylaeus volcanicus]
MASRFLAVFVVCAVLFESCPAKPTQLRGDPSKDTDPLRELWILSAETDNLQNAKRVQRSPQLGFPNEGYGLVSERERRRHRKQCEFGCEGGYVPEPGFYPGGGLGGVGIGGALANAESNGFNAGPFGGPDSLADAESGGFNAGPFGGPGALANAESGGLIGSPFGGSGGGASAQAGGFNGGLLGGSGAAASAGAGGPNIRPLGGGDSQANAQSANFNFGPFSASFSTAESSSNNQRY